MPFSFNNVSIISVLLETLTNFNGLLFNSEISAINTVNTAYNPNIADTTFTNFLQIETIGQHLYTTGAFLLIITSVILLLAMVAPIFISKK
jgi:NADH-ubiquinone oxidoreductase chain 6